MTRPVIFDEAAALRIVNTIRKVETGDRAERPLTFDAVPPTQRKVFRIATFTGAWSISDLKTVTLKYQTSTPNTLSATNLTMHLPVVGTATAFDCGIAKDGTAWFLVSALEHNVKRGTATAPWSKGSSATVTLASGGTVSVLNRHADVPGSGTKNVSVARDGMEWELIAAECD
jgi:hypothetical protein